MIMGLWYLVTIGSLACAPWFSVLLADAGMHEHHIPLVLSALPLTTLLGAPLWSSLADATGRTRLLLRLAATVHVVLSALLLFVHAPTALALTIVLWSMARTPLGPLGDTITLEVLGSDRRRYGTFRAWGSVAYLLLVLTTSASRETHPHTPILATLLLSVGIVAVTCVLPDLGGVKNTPRADSVATILLRPRLAAIVVVGIIHGTTLAVYDHLLSLHLTNLGHPAGVIGASIACGVAAEIAVLFFGSRLLATFGPQRLFLLAVASGIPRWAIVGTTDDAVLLIGAQLLHGLGFGAFWLSGVALLAEDAPEGSKATAQSLLPASTYGLGALLGLGLSSLVLRVSGTDTLFLIMAAISLVATVAAVTLFRLSSLSGTAAPPQSGRE